MSARPEIRMMSENHRLCNPRHLPDYDEVVSTVGGHLLATYGDNLPAYTEDFKDDQLDYPMGFGRYHGMFEIINKEYIDKLTQRLAESALRIRPDGEKVKIAEVGAGLGRLTHFVCQSALAMGVENLDMFASDTGAMAFRKGLNVPFDVLNENYTQSLRVHKPQIVVVSWMPPYHDWTAAFRNSACVQEYMIIGQPNICGNSQSWASRKRGFARHVLHDLSGVQIGFKDDLYPYEFVGKPVPMLAHKSRTVSFTRV
jgi:hypothetical protein